MAVKPTLVVYDIAEDGARRRVAGRLASVGYRCLYSVFECFGRQGRAQPLMEELANLVDSADRLLVVPTCRRCRTAMVGRPLEAGLSAGLVVG